MDLFKIFNIKIKISYLFFFILIFSMFFNYFYQMLILTIVVLIHELAHSAIAIYYGIKILEIKLFVFGGVARAYGDIESNPKEEIAIALAGPLSNLIIIVCTFFIINKFNIKMYNLLSHFLTVNFTIGVFNFVPVLPLDGGRIVRGILSSYIGVKRATYIVIKTGYFVCVLLFGIGIYLGLVYNIEYIFLIGLSIYMFFCNKNEKDKISFMYVKNLVLKKKTLFSEGIMDAKYIIAMDFVEIKKIFSEFTLEQYYIITITDTKGKVIGCLSESEIIDAILKYDNNMTLGNLIKIHNQGV